MCVHGGNRNVLYRTSCYEIWHSVQKQVITVGVTMKNMPLLDYLHLKTGCEYLSDLHWLNSIQKIRLVQEIEQISAEEVSLHEWNDALAYLLDLPPKPTADTARNALITALQTQAEEREEYNSGA